MKNKIQNKYELEVTFNEYVGNFEREFCAYVFGYAEYGCHDWVHKLQEMFGEEEGVEFADNFCEYLEHFHDEHGPTICYISNPCEILCVKFDKNPKEHIPMILRRIDKFPSVLATCWEFAPKK
jgi:hypothetical protein